MGHSAGQGLALGATALKRTVGGTARATRTYAENSGFMTLGRRVFGLRSGLSLPPTWPMTRRRRLSRRLANADPVLSAWHPRPECFGLARHEAKRDDPVRHKARMVRALCAPRPQRQRLRERPGRNRNGLVCREDSQTARVPLASTGAAAADIRQPASTGGEVLTSFFDRNSRNSARWIASHRTTGL